jgi:peroxiredoxin family protein
MEGKVMKDKVALIAHSGDMDKIYSALIIGNGALAMGMEVTIFFTFWGLQRLRKDNALSMPKGGLEKGPLSRMHMLGLGKWMIEQRMDKANVASLEKLMVDFKELGGKIIACDMTMEIMGISRDDLREDLIDDYGAVGTYIQEARESAITLFI